LNILNFEDFPFAEFGEEPKRKVRLLVSPETTGEKRCDIVVTTVPPGGISEGHVHTESDEYIYFDIGGKARLDGIEYTISPRSFVHAAKGVCHECENTSDRELTLVCFFVPAFEPYGKYPEIIEKTKKMLERKKR
jgi:uncharacterized cupin superfamily protein